MAVSAGFQGSKLCPAPVAIEDHGDVLRLSEPLNFFDDAAAVEAIEQAFT
jgi:hypothetical protein